MSKQPYPALLLAILSILTVAAPRHIEVDQDPAQRFLESLGPDDGASFAIIFGGNLRGSLELCDCNNPRGGLARRIGYIQGFRRKFPKTPVIQVESGNFFTDATDYTGKMVPAVLLQNDQVIGALNRWKFDVINLSRNDVLYARRLFAIEGFKDRLTSLPAIRNIISANTTFGSASLRPSESIIREIRGPRINGKLRVAFIGLTEPIRMSEGTDGLVTDPSLAAHRLVADARKNADVVVMVAHVEHETAAKLAQETPGIDVVIAGNCAGAFQPRMIGKTLVVCTAPGNTHEGDLRAYVSRSGEISFKVRATELNADVPADPEAVAYVDKAREDIVKLKSAAVR